MSELQFWTDGTNTVIATDRDDALKAYEETIGDPWDPADGEAEELTSSPGSANPMTVRYESEEDICAFAKAWPRKKIGGYVGVTAPSADWIAGHGRGYFTSTEV